MNREWVLQNARAFNVRSPRFGAKGDGTTSAAIETAAFNAAIDAARNYQAIGANCTVYIPEGFYNLNPLDTIDSTGGFCLMGDGPRSTILNFVPTGNNQSLIKFDKGSTGPVQNHSLQNFVIKTSDTTYSKTAIHLRDVGSMGIDNVGVVNWYGNNTDSIALRVEGRESLWVKNCRLDAVLPIYLMRNAYTANGYISADHFNFHNLYMQIPTQSVGVSQQPLSPLLKSACVQIEAGSNIFDLQFSGSQAWVGGDYGLYWKHGKDITPTPILAVYNNNRINLRNIRTEQQTLATGYSVYIDMGNYAEAGSLYQLTMDNVQFDSGREGFYTRNVWNVSLTDSVVLQPTGRKICDVGNALSMKWDNVTPVYNADPAGIVLDANMYFVESSPHMKNNQFPTSSHWARRNVQAPYGEYPKREMLAHTWHWSGSLVDGVTTGATVGAMQMPFNGDAGGNNWIHAIVKVIASDGATIMECGEWAVSKSAVGTLGILKISGTANTASTDTDGNLCLYSSGASPLAAPIYVRNRLGVTCQVTVEVMGKRSQET